MKITIREAVAEHPNYKITLEELKKLPEERRIKILRETSDIDLLMAVAKEQDVDISVREAVEKHPMYKK